jgi:hypothetical protein
MLELFRRISIPHFAEHKLRTSEALQTEMNGGVK